MLGPDDLGEMRPLLMKARKNDDCDAKDPEPDLPLKPFLIANTVERAVGYEAAKKVQLRNKPEEQNTYCEIIPHPTLSYVQGIVYDLDTINEEEQFLEAQLKSEGVTKVKRITKKVDGTRKNTPLLILTFNALKRPDYVKFGLLRVKVRTFYPSPMLCFKCAEYGHGKNKCPSSSTICLRCSKEHEKAENLPCTNTAFCKNCNGSHTPVTRDCPKYKEEEEAIIKIKVDRDISFSEALNIYRESNRDYSLSNIVQRRLASDSDEKDRIIGRVKSCKVRAAQPS
ncbi:uncharacterized protein LOC129742647 [Uranotaenia lowii]|uniref:uncharacterized protein LOC129742647 n=1 Tax=Uranotaenia lowii TaxID=190385 RepID=UPI00247A7821|nr:uncharacterized protein LOC129742647 [Uranotaenia lowii]